MWQPDRTEKGLQILEAFFETIKRMVVRHRYHVESGWFHGSNEFGSGDDTGFCEYLPTVPGERAFQVPKYDIAFLKFTTHRRSNQFQTARIVAARRGWCKEKIPHSGESHQRKHSCIGTHDWSADIRASQS